MELKLGILESFTLAKEGKVFKVWALFHALTECIRTTRILCLVYRRHDIASRQKKTDIETKEN